MTWRPSVVALAALAVSTASSGQARLAMDFEHGVRIEEATGGSGATILRPEESAASAVSGKGGVRIGVPTIQYEGGTPAQRSARVIADPLRPANRVIEFRVAEPNVVVDAAAGRRKSRVQMNLYGNTGANELYLSARLYIDPGMSHLQEYPRAFDWLTLAEFWNGAPWLNHEHPFRITLNLQKPEPGLGSAIHLAVRAEAMRAGRRDFRDAELWQATDQVGRVAFGQWMTLEYYLREGDQYTGRLAFAVTTEGQPRRVVFDLQRPTVHPESRERSGFRHVNPLKLYTSQALTEHLAGKGQQLRVLWDDLTVEACSTPLPDTTTSCMARWLSR